MTAWEIDFGQIHLNKFDILVFFIVVDTGTSRVVLRGTAHLFATPTMDKPYVERTIKTLKHEWLSQFQPYHNKESDHFRLPPDEAFPTLPILPKVPEIVNPDAWLHEYHGKVYRRRVTSLQIDKHKGFTITDSAF